MSENGEREFEIGDYFEKEEGEKDSGLLGSMLEAQLTKYKKGFCRQCDKPMEDKPPQDSFCTAECREDWSILVNVRIEIGKRDLEIRGYD